MSTVSKYLVRRGGQQYGPYTLDVLLHYYSQGQILGTDLVWTDGYETWITAAQLSSAVPPGGKSPGAAGPPAQAGKPPRRPIKPWVWGAGAAAVVLAVIVVVALLSGPRPEDSLDRARAAYLQRDQVNFDKYVDVTSVLSDGVDQIASVILQQNNTGGIARLAIEAAIPALKSIYLPSTAQAVDQFIISGNLPQDSQSSSRDPASTLVAGYVSAALRKVAASALSYQGVESRQISGSSATLSVRVATPLSGQPMVLRVRMQKGDGYWRVVAIEDVAGLVRKLEGLAAQGASPNLSAGAAPAPAAPDAPAPAPAPVAPASAPTQEPTSASAATPPSAAPASVISNDGSAPSVPEPAAEAAAPVPSVPAPAPAAPASDDDDPIGPGRVITPPAPAPGGTGPNP